MSYKKLFPVLLLLLVLSVGMLASCKAVEVVAVSVTNDSVYKTEYLVGEELDITGIKLEVKTSDDESYTVYATDVRQDIRILNFNTGKERENLVVIIEYKGCTTDIIINVKKSDAAKIRYTVAYSTGEGSEVASESVAEYGKASVPEDPTRAGYAFDGWYKENTYNTAFNFSTEVIDRNVTLYAKWAKLYYITFRVDGEIIAIKEVKEGKTLADIPPVPLREGQDGTWDRTTFTNIYTNVNVNAQYSVKQFTVNFYYRDPVSAENILIRSFPNIPYNCRFEEEYAEYIAALEVPDKLGNTVFSNWDKAFVNITNNLDVYAVYSATKHVVTFGLNYAPDDNPSYISYPSVTYGNPISRPQLDPTREGYAFGGWYRQASCTVEWDFNRSAVEGDTILYAKWDKLNKIRFLVAADIVLDEPIEESVIIGGTEYGVYAVIEALSGSSVAKPTVPSRKGYSGEWNVADAALADITEDLDVYVSYTINYYRVAFYNYNYTLLAESNVAYGEQAVPPEETPVRNGYCFENWNKDYSFVEGPMEIIAEFAPNYYNVRIYDKNDSSNRIINNVRFDGLIPLTDPVNTGYRFDGWYTDNGTYLNEWKIGEMVLDRYEVVDGVVLTLYSKWIPLYNITFYAEDGVATVATFTVDGGNVIPEDKIPSIDERVGHTASWQEFLNGSLSEYNWDRVVSGNLSFKPVYTPIAYTLHFFFPETECDTRTVLYGQTLAPESVPSPAPRDGRTFVSWRIGDITLIPVEEDMNIYSNYTTAEYGVHWYNANNVEIVTTKVEHGAPAIFPSNDYDLPVSKGCTFAKWVADSGDELTRIYRETYVRPEFYINSYSLTFRNPLTNEEYAQIEHGGTAQTMSQSLSYGTYVNMGLIMPDENVPPQVGKDFIGWSATRNGEAILLERRDVSGAKLWQLSCSDSDEDAYVGYGVCVVRDDGIYYVEGVYDMVNLLQTDDWMSDAYELKEENGEWRLYRNGVLDSSLLTDKIAFAYGVYYMIEGDLAFESVFEISRYSVTYRVNPNGFDLGGAIGGDEVEIYFYGANPIAKTFDVTDGDSYIFVGWYLDAGFKSRYDFEDPDNYMNADIELFARWELRSASVGVRYEINATGTAYMVVGVDNANLPENGKISIANYYDGLPVNEIKAEAFLGSAKIKEIYLPSTISKIGPKAFMNAVLLKKISIPDLIENIPDNCFNGCKELETVTFGAQSELKTIGTGAFSGCVKLSSDMTSGGENSLPDRLVEIKDGAFYNCAAFDKLYIPASVNTISDRAFAKTSALSYVVFRRANPCLLGVDVFANTGVLYASLRIYVGNGAVASYKTSTNANWELLRDKIYSYDDIDDANQWSYYIEANKAVLVQYIGSSVDGSVTIPATVKKTSRVIIEVDESGAPVYADVTTTYSVDRVSEYAFGSGVYEVVIPAEVAIGAYTFAAAVDLGNLVLGDVSSGSSDTLRITPENLYNAFTFNASLDTLTLTSSSHSLGVLFGGASPAGLRHIRLNFSGATSIGAFANNANLLTIEIGGGISSIAENSFAGCTSLQKVVFSTAATNITIGAQAFYGDINLAEFYDRNKNEKLPDAIGAIGKDAFDGTAWLKNRTEKFIIVGNGVLYKYNGSDSHVVLPETVKNVATYAFYGYSRLTVLDASQAINLTEIGVSALEECVSLETVVLPSSVDAIRANAFYNDSKLTTLISYRAGNTEVDSNAFYGVSSLTIFTTDSERRNIGGAANRVYYLANINIGEEWIYGYGTSIGSAVTLIKALNSTEVTVPSAITVEGIANVVVKYIADYAVLRSVESLDVDLSISPHLEEGEYSESVFGGATRVNSLTLRGTASATLAPSMRRLMTSASGLVEISSDAKSSMGAVLGAVGALPARITTVRIIGFDKNGSTNSIAAEFLKDCSHVENVLMEYVGESQAVALGSEDDNVSVTAQVGSDAFAGTAWKANNNSDFIIILGGNLIDYKGASALAVIPTDVKRVNGGAFSGAGNIEVLYMPDTVIYIGKNAFSGATHLTKLIMYLSDPAATSCALPTLQSNEIFYGSNCPEILVPTVTQGYDTGYWKEWSTKVTSTLVKVTKRIGAAQGYNIYERYIFDTASEILHFYEQFRGVDTGDDIVTVESLTEIVLPSSLYVGDDGVGAPIYRDKFTLGKNVFVHSVTSVRLSSSLTYAAQSFANLKDNFNKIAIDGVKENVVQSSVLYEILYKYGVKCLEYDGSRTLDTLLGLDASSVYPHTLVSICITAGVKETKPNLLKNWNWISEVTLPDSIEKVGANSFENTAWFENYPSDFILVGNGVLYKYKGASSTIYIPARVRIVNTGAFSTLTANGESWNAASTLRVNTIRFESGSVAYQILDYAFAGCTYLNKIDLPSTMKYIDPSAFDGTLFTVKNGMLIVAGDKQGSTLVKYYGNDETVVIPSDVKVISANAFEDNPNIVTLNAQTSMLSVISEKAFFNCTNLENILLPSTLSSIGKQAFHNTMWLAKHKTAGTDAIFPENDSTSMRKILYQKIAWNGMIYVIKSDIISITEGAFDSFSFSIGSNTYSYTAGISTITLDVGAKLSTDDMYGVLKSETVVRFQSNGAYSLDYLIGGREPLSNITALGFIFGADKKIAARYAYGWTSVVSVDVPTTTTYIGAEAFVGTEWYENKTQDYIAAGGILIKYNGNDEVIIINSDSNGDPIRGIAEDVFRGNTKIRKVLFNAINTTDLTELCAQTFMGCSSLELIGVLDGRIITNEEFEALEINDMGIIMTEGEYFGLDIAYFEKVADGYLTAAPGIPTTIVGYGEDVFAGTKWLQDRADENNGFVIIRGTMIAYLDDAEGATPDNVVIPAETKRIYSYVFRGNDNVMSVTFDRYCLMESIEANTFRDCVNLSKITLSETITYVDRSALQGTAWIAANTMLTYVDSYNEINRLILYVGEDGYLVMPDAITEINANAFKGVTTITNIIFNMNSKVRRIPKGAFEGCTSLASVTVDVKLTEIEEGAFDGTPYIALRDFNIVGGVLVAYNGSDAQVVLPPNVNVIAADAFRGNNTITAIDMSATSVTELVAGTFDGCSALASVTMPSTLVKVGGNAFRGTPYLDNLVAALTPEDKNRVIVNNGGNYILLAVKSGAENYEIPAYVKYLAFSVFAGNASVKSITFTSYVEIEDGAFRDCAALDSIGGLDYVAISAESLRGTKLFTQNTADDFTIVGGRLIAYSGAGGDVVIPASVRIVESGVFTGNASIRSLSFAPTSVDGEPPRYDSVSIMKDAFRNCVNLASVTLSPATDAIGYRAFYNTAWTSAFDSAYIIVDGKLLSYIKEENEIIIGKDVDYVAANVFSGNSNITRVGFVDRVSTVVVEEGAFANCTRLNSIAFPANIKVGKDAFVGTPWYNRQGNYVTIGSDLIAYTGTSWDIAIPENVTFIYDYVFGGNTNLYQLSFVGNSRMTHLTGNVFADCTGLTVVYLPSGLVELEISAFKGTPWLEAQGAFIMLDTKLLAYNGELATVEIPAYTSSIAIMSLGENVFKNHTEITEVIFKEGSLITSIPDGTFAGCTSLTNIVFPDRLTGVSRSAFEGALWYDNLPEGGYIHNGVLLLYKDITVEEGEAKVTEYTLTDDIVAISADAFVGTDITTVIVTVLDPYSVDPGYALTGMTIYVPNGKLTDFRNAWPRYDGNLRERDSDI